MQAAKTSYDAMTVKELKLLCKKYDIKGCSSMTKSKLVSHLNHVLKSSEEGDDLNIKPSYSYIKKTPHKILNTLIENKKLILLQKFKDKSGNWILYHVDTLLVFANMSDKKTDNYIAIGYLNEQHQVYPLTKDHIYICKEWNFDYILPENLSLTEADTFQNSELQDIIENVNNIIDDLDNEDDEEFIPNYDDVF